MADAVDDAEKDFPFPDLIENEYFKKYKRAYYRTRNEGWQLSQRNYFNLIIYLKNIYEYNQQHAKGFAKAIRSVSTDWNNCEAIFSEILVYRYYVRLVYEEVIKSIGQNKGECDLIVERLDNSLAYLEIFCVKPNLKIPKEGEFIIQDIKTHMQEEMASIRQKLLRKIKKQKQLTKPRDNYAVIELNDPSIADDFHILSSLSGGYKIKINTKTMEQVSAGYDWNNSIFHDESTNFLKAIIYFSLGDYESRKFIFNPRFRENKSTKKSM
jgi:tRNA threonylcarbamoyladenosine modification (KEOPS) complex Cgi121 subunit